MKSKDRQVASPEKGSAVRPALAPVLAGMAPVLLVLLVWQLADVLLPLPSTDGERLFRRCRDLGGARAYGWTASHHLQPRRKPQ